MNLTLSLAINGGGGGTTTTKKRKLQRDSSVVVDDVMSCDGHGDHSKHVVMRLLQASRGRMMEAKLDADADADDPRVAAAAAAPDVDSGGGGLRLMHLLLSSVAAAESGDARAAATALHEVRRRASSRGADPAQRVAAYFADALASSSSRLAVRWSSSSPPLAAAAGAEAPPPTRAERFLAYTMFYQASPMYQFAHFTANQAIVEAFESGGGRRRLHVVDFDVSYGFQWPSLIQSLSHAAAAAASTSTTSSSSHDDVGDGDCCAEPAAAVSLRITGLGTSPDELRQTEARLARFASGFPNLRFEFEGIVVDGPPDDGGRRRREPTIKVDDDATVVVNLVFPAAARGSTREDACSTALARIRSLNPSLVFLVEKDGGGGGNATSRGRSSSLLPPFTASLRYFAAVFDSLHECLPADSAERIAIERNHLGVEISDAMACLDDHSMEEPSSSSWKQVMERAGFEGVELSSRTVSQAKLLLKMKSGGGGGGGFRVIEGEGGRAMSLAWRDRAPLITATAWRRRRCRSINNTQALFS